MRELLEQAHKENEEDAIFAEEEDDAEFEAPGGCHVIIANASRGQGCISRGVCGDRR